LETFTKTAARITKLRKQANMNEQTPEKKVVASTASKTTSPTDREDSLIDPPDCIAPGNCKI